MNRVANILTTLASAVFVVNSAAEPLKEGAEMPTVTQKNQDERNIKLSASMKGYVLVYFYPKADTPGCVKQACSLRDSFSTFVEKGVKVYGVSKDGAKAQKAFKDKYLLPFDLLADVDGVVLKAFGVPSAMGFAKRQAFLFKDGKLVWRDLTASTAQQAADVIEFLEKKP